MLQLRRLWLQSISMNFLDKSADWTKVLKTVLFRNCELVLVKRADVESSDSLRDPITWGGGVISKFPKFRGQRLLNASHITPYI